MGILNRNFTATVNEDLLKIFIQVKKIRKFSLELFEKKVENLSFKKKQNKNL